MEDYYLLSLIIYNDPNQENHHNLDFDCTQY